MVIIYVYDSAAVVSASCWGKDISTLKEAMQHSFKISKLQRHKNYEE